jgi:hypothetical protein
MDEFALGLNDLVVQAAQDPFDRKGAVILDEFLGEAECLHRLAVITFEKEAAFVAKDVGFE